MAVARFIIKSEKLAQVVNESMCKHGLTFTFFVQRTKDGDTETVFEMTGDFLEENAKRMKAIPWAFELKP